MSVIEIEGLSKTFDRKPVLKSVSLNLEDSGIFTILGPNASGKTTLIKSILGMVFPDSGEVRINGLSVKNQFEYKRQINYLPQIARFPENLKVYELLNFISDLRGKSARKDELIEMFSLNKYLKERINILSGGTKQKVNVLLAFMYDNPILILDEPTNGLDPIALVRLKELIKKEREAGKCILITTHIMQLVEDLSDRIIYMLEGHIHFDGNLSSLKSTYGASTVENCIANMLESSSKTIPATIV